MLAKNVAEKTTAVLNACALCEHSHPRACQVCTLDPIQPINDPWWRDDDVKEVKRINVASGEDVLA